MSGDLGRTLGDDYIHQLPDTDPTETQEWIDSLDRWWQPRARCGRVS